MKIKNKLFMTFLFLLAFILFFNIKNVFAINVSINDNTYNIPDFSSVIEYDYQFICLNEESNIFYLVDSMSPLYYDGYNTIDYFNSHQQFKTLNSDTFKAYKYSSDSSEWSSWSSNTSVNFKTSYIYIYSNYDVMNGINGTSVFFQQTPVKEVTAIQIPALETAEQIPEAIAKTLMIVIPVGLIVLGTGLVIYLIKRAIYLTR